MGREERGTRGQEGKGRRDGVKAGDPVCIFKFSF